MGDKQILEDPKMARFCCPPYSNESHEFHSRPPPYSEAAACECANCCRPVFSEYIGKEVVVGEFSAGVEEEFYFFLSCHEVELKQEYLTFNGNVFGVVTCCDCDEELGYQLFKVREIKFPSWRHDYFAVRSAKVKAMAQPRFMKSLDFVNNEVLYALSLMPNPVLALTPNIWTTANHSAYNVSKFVEADFDLKIEGSTSDPKNFTSN